VRPWGSALSSAEFAAIRGAGFEPAGQVFGAAVYDAGAAAARCPGTGEYSGDRTAAGHGSFGPLVHALYQARQAALDRMSGECARLGGHGVVGVRLTRGSFRLGGVEFTAIGTAVRAPGATRGPRVPFTSDLSGQDFAKLITAGWVPAGLALGVCVGARHDDRATVRQARWTAGNREIAGWTELVGRARQDARAQLAADVRRLGADGVVVASVQLRASQQDCPQDVGRRDHIAEVSLIGTAIVRFAGPAVRAAAPPLAVMSLGPGGRAVRG
jgi:uncharacterized protein YbjQ (UPF0145 family)